MSRVTRVAAWTLVVLWVVVIVLAVRDGSRESTYADLVAGLRAGEVTEVTVLGDVTAARTVGGVELRWDGGIVDNRAYVTAVSPPPRTDRVRSDRVVLPAPVADTLRTRFPDVTVRTAGPSSGTGAWLAALSVAALLGTFLTLATTSRPLRATQWAWFWVFWILPPVGLVAFLLLGGPTGLAPQREGGRRLTGGWAFLLALVLGGTSLVTALAT